MNVESEEWAALKRRVSTLELTCCTPASMKSQTETHLLVSQLMVQMERMNDRVDALYRFMYIVTGVYLALQALGVSDILGKVLK